MSLNHCLLIILTAFVIGITGCSRNTAEGSKPSGSVTGASEKADHSGSANQTTPVSLELKPPTPAERYQEALLLSFSLLAEKKYEESLESLRVAQAAADSMELQFQITRVQGLIQDQQSFDKTASDIQAIIDAGQAQEASALIMQAMAHYHDAEQLDALNVMKRQSEALMAVSSSDMTQQLKRLRDEADQALTAGNLRAALLAYELSLSLKPDSAVQGQGDTLRSRLGKYDAAMLRAAQLRRDAFMLESALEAYQEAIQIWDNSHVRLELADAHWALRCRRDRIAILPFESFSNDELAAYGTAIADELLPYFKRKYDLVDRSILHRVLHELNPACDEVINGQQSRSALEKLTTARYLVVGRILPISGLTIHARLIDLKSGLVIQTGKLVAPTPDAMIKQLSRLAAQLLFSDDEQLAYQRQQMQAVAPQVISHHAAMPALPVYSSLTVAVPAVTTTNKPPAFGTLQHDEFERLPTKESVSLLSSSLTPVEQERPLKQRLLALQLELGDDHYRMGRHSQSLQHYQFARELDPANMDVVARINLCYQYLPPVSSQTEQARREKLALLNFYVTGDPRSAPLEMSTWVPEQLAPYYAAHYDVMDSGAVYWIMGRLGLTLGDVIRDASVRRWLGRALGIRYLVVGRVQHVGSLTIAISLIDTEHGWESGRSQIIVRGIREIKHGLPGLARCSMASAADRARLEQEAAHWEAEYLRAQEASQRGQFTVAWDIGKLLQKSQPMNIRFSVLLNDAEERARRFSWEEARLIRLEKQRQEAERVARQQAELALAAEQSRLMARQKAQQMGEMVRRRQQEQASGQLVTQARLAIRNNNLALALQLFDGALALKVADNELLREADVVRVRLANSNRQTMMERMNKQSESLRRQQDLELAAGRQIWAKERQQWLQFSMEQQKIDLQEQARLMEQAQRLKSQGRFDQSASLLQGTRRIQASPVIEQLLADVLVEQARTQAKSEDAAKFAELERKLAQETARRKQAELEAQRNWTRYQAALQQAREAKKNKNIAVMKEKSREAVQLFKTEEAIALWKMSVAEENDANVRLAMKQKQLNEQKIMAEDVSRLLKESKALEQGRNYDAAIKNLQTAQRLDSVNEEVLTSLKRVKLLRQQEIDKQQVARDQESRVKEYLQQAQGRIKLKQFAAAQAILESAKKLAPANAQLTALSAEVLKLQEAESQELASARKKEAELRNITQQRILAEETAKRQAKQNIAQAEAALRSGDLKTAVASLDKATKHAPNDPALIKLQQEVAKAQNVASREKGEADARANLDTLAQSKQSAAAREQQTRIGELLKLAQAAIKKKEYHTAEKLISDSLTLDSTNLAAGRMQRELQIARQADERAKSALSAVDRKRQEEEQARKKIDFTRHMKEGKEALAAEDYEQATKSFTAAKALNPEDPDAALFLGMANRNTERKKAEEVVARKVAEENKKREMEAAKAEIDSKKKAEEELRKKLAMDAEAKKRAETLKAVNKQQFDNAVTQGKQALAGRKYDEAVKAFERATQLMPDDQNANKLLSQARQLKAESAKPEKKPPEKVITPAKTSKTALMSRATSLQNEKKWGEALAAYRQLLAMAPADADANAGAVHCEFQLHLDAGNIALRKKDKQAAVKGFEAALKLVPDNAEAQKLLKQARELQ